MGFWDNAGKAIMSASESMQKERARMERIYKEGIRKKTDQEIRNGLNNMDSSNWRYDFLREEARRRGL